MQRALESECLPVQVQHSLAQSTRSSRQDGLGHPCGTKTDTSGCRLEFRGSIFRTIRFLTCSDDDHVVLLGKFLGHGVCVLRASLCVRCVSRSFVSNAGGTRRSARKTPFFGDIGRQLRICGIAVWLPLLLRTESDSASAGGERQLAPSAADTPKWTLLVALLGENTARACQTVALPFSPKY
jgi:hypothetical protein